MNKGKALIFSAPSGSGKTTIVRHILSQNHTLKFSISATTRPPRGKEVHGVDYYFLSKSDFEEKISNNEFLEWEEVYTGVYYGTLRSETNRIWQAGNHVVFDVDVAGGVNIKTQLGDRALAVFIKVKDRATLKDRLISRGTETDEQIALRLNKADEELAFEPKFDVTVLNDRLEEAVNHTALLVNSFIDR